MPTATYCTLSDLEDAVTHRRLVETTNDEDPTATGEVVTSKVDAAIAAAGDMIDGFVGKRHPLPLPTVPEILRRVAVDLSLYYLFSRVRDLSDTDSILRRKKDAEKLLERIRDGEVSLGISAAAVAPNPVGPVVASGRPLFSSHRMERMDASTSGMYGCRP